MKCICEELNKNIFVLKRRGNIYGPFLNKKTANEFGLYKKLNETDKQFDNIEGYVHEMSLKDFIENSKFYSIN